MLGDETLLYRFNRHYEAIMKYMSLNSNGEAELIGDGSCMKTVHMVIRMNENWNLSIILYIFNYFIKKSTCQIGNLATT